MNCSSEGQCDATEFERSLGSGEYPPPSDVDRALSFTVLFVAVVALCLTAYRKLAKRPARRPAPRPRVVPAPAGPLHSEASAHAEQPPTLPAHPASRTLPAAGQQPSQRPGSLSETADAALSSLLVLPFSLTQYAVHLAKQHLPLLGATPAPPAWPPEPPSKRTPPTRLGFAVGEADDLEEESEDLTAAELRKLQASPEFRTHLQAKHMSWREVETIAGRLRLYKRLQEVDPGSLSRLVDAPLQVETQDPRPLTLAADYLLSLLLNIAAAAAVWYGWRVGPRQLPIALRLVVSFVAWRLTAACWLRGRTTAGRWFGLWYAELQWGHAAPAWRCLGANLVEALYVVLTLGLGALVSLALRCCSSRRQSVGELLARVAPVQEWQQQPQRRGAGG